jgi:hypothetical protein
MSTYYIILLHQLLASIVLKYLLHSVICILLCQHYTYQCRWEVPLPRTMKVIYSSLHQEGTDPRFVKLEPVFRCSMLKCGGIQRYLSFYLFDKYFGILMEWTKNLLPKSGSEGPCLGEVPHHIKKQKLSCQ